MNQENSPLKRLAVKWGNGIVTTTLIVFVTLKLSGKVEWSWWWVLSPVWIPLSVALVSMGVLGLMFLFFSKKKDS